MSRKNKAPDKETIMSEATTVKTKNPPVDYNELIARLEAAGFAPFANTIKGHVAAVATANAAVKAAKKTLRKASKTVSGALAMVQS